MQMCLPVHLNQPNRIPKKVFPKRFLSGVRLYPWHGQHFTGNRTRVSDCQIQADFKEHSYITVEGLRLDLILYNQYRWCLLFVTYLRQKKELIKIDSFNFTNKHSHKLEKDATLLISELII